MKLLVLHWGTRGAGPQIQEHIASALVANLAAEVSVSFDASSESARRLGSLTVPKLVIGRAGSSSKWWLFKRLAAQPMSAWKLVRFCRVNSIDVVYEVMDHPFQLAPRIVARLCGIRVLTSVHDAVRHPGEESRLLDLIAQVSLRASDGVMTYSAAVARKLRVVTAIGRVQIFQTVIGAFGAPQQRGGARSAPNAPFTVGFFGRIEAYKGLARLAGAIVELRERGVDVRLSIHGRGQLSASEQLLLEQADAKVNNSWVSDTEIQAVIESFDILALPYDDASQSGVIGYALSSGTPTVATPVEGLREQVSDSGGGILARGMTTHDFAAALEELIVDPKLYRTLSEHAVESARSTYSWDRVSADILSAARLLAKAPKA